LNQDGKEPVLFGEKMEPGCLKQGSLGCCYLLSALSVLTATPERITDHFITKEINEEGVYGIVLYKNGQK